MRFRDAHEQFDHAFRIVAVSDSNGHINSPPLRRQRPIDDLVREQVAVGDDHLCALERYDGTRTGTDSPNNTHEPAYFHCVSNMDGTLKKQDQAGNKVVYDVLQAEAQTNA